MIDKKKNLVKKIASERIEVLFDEAGKTAGKDPERSRRYVYNIRKISSHYKVKIPKKMKKAICRNCNAFLTPGLNAKVRIVSSKRFIAYTCKNCGKETHIKY